MVNKGLFVFTWIAIGVISRCIIHLPDVTPITSLCLLSGTVFSKRHAMWITLCMLALSDIFLSVFFNEPLFGLWTLFNYSGWLAVTALGFYLVNDTSLFRSLTFTLLASVGFWIWTNFGTWCGGFHLYPHTFAGLATCYVAAIPFLKNSVLGSLAWTALLSNSSALIKTPLLRAFP